MKITKLKNSKNLDKGKIFKSALSVLASGIILISSGCAKKEIESPVIEETSISDVTSTVEKTTAVSQEDWTVDFEEIDSELTRIKNDILGSEKDKFKVYMNSKQELLVELNQFNDIDNLREFMKGFLNHYQNIKLNISADLLSQLDDLDYSGVKSLNVINENGIYDEKINLSNFVNLKELSLKDVYIDNDIPNFEIGLSYLSLSSNSLDSGYDISKVLPKLTIPSTLPITDERYLNREVSDNITIELNDLSDFEFCPELFDKTTIKLNNCAGTNILNIWSNNNVSIENNSAAKGNNNVIVKGVIHKKIDINDENFDTVFDKEDICIQGVAFYNGHPLEIDVYQVPEFNKPEVLALS